MQYFGKSDFKCIFAQKMHLHSFCRYRSTLLEKVDLQVFFFLLCITYVLSYVCTSNLHT